MAADGDCTGHPAAATVTTRVKETTQGKQASTDLYKFPDIQIYPDQWLDDIPPISQVILVHITCVGCICNKTKW